MAGHHSLREEAFLAERGKALLESHYDLIQRKLQHLSRRSGLPDHEAEELRSWALFKLVEDDYRILASWEGRSTLSTYLTVVLVSLMRDYRTAPDTSSQQTAKAPGGKPGLPRKREGQRPLRSSVPFDRELEA